jgi:hypothetical protein
MRRELRSKLQRRRKMVNASANASTNFRYPAIIHQPVNGSVTP